MKPNNLKQTKFSKGIARVKLSLRVHLSWLSAYPVNQQGAWFWCCPLAAQPDEATKLTGKHMSKAARVINELYRDYPLALPMVVGDRDTWVSRSKAYLEYCKTRLAHKHAAMPGLFAQDRAYQQTYKTQLKQLYAEVQPIVDALSWMHFVQRQPLKKAFQLLIKHQTDFAALSKAHVGTALRLCALYEWDAAKAQNVIDLLLKPHELTVATYGGETYAKAFFQYKIATKTYKPLVEPEKPDKLLYPALEGFVQHLMRMNRARRRRALSLLKCTNLRARAHAWLAWWEEAEALTRQISNLAQSLNTAYFQQANDGDRHSALNARRQKLSQKQGDLLRFTQRCPRALFISSLLDTIECLSEQAPLTKASLKVLAHLPNSADPGVFLHHFHVCYTRQKHNVKLITAYLSAFDGYLKKAQGRRCLTPWKTLLDDENPHYYCTPKSDLLMDLSDRQFPLFFQLMSDLNALDLSVEKADVAYLVAVTTAEFGRERGADLAAYLMKNSLLHDTSDSVLRMAQQMHESNHNIAKLIAIWHKLDEAYTNDDTLEECFKLYTQSDGLNAQALFRDRVYSGQIKALIYSGYQVKLIQKIDGAEHVPGLANSEPKEADWIAWYPDVFNGVLKQFNAVSPKAQKKVQKVFAAHWWSKGMLQAEINDLQHRLSGAATGNLEKRIANLQQRLLKHQPISDSVQQKVQKKIAQQISHEQFLHWQEAVHLKFTRAWCRFFQIEVDSAPAWLFEPSVLSQLLPIVDFNPRSRRLAIKIIQRRCAAPPWDFCEEPENQHFLQRITQLGLNCQVWVSGIGDKQYQAATGNRITITLATDPLDILNMGGHFKTCLSPGQFNFFSVFANIADINKRVLYGKTRQGKIIGRVLIGLTPAGGIQVFNLYCHNADDQFSTFVLDYIQVWAAQLGAVLTQRGELPTLVADEWYDDGAIDLDNGIACFRPESSFRQQLRALDPSVFEATVRAALDPLPLNELTLPLLLHLPELEANTTLIPEMMALAARVRGLNRQDKRYLYQLSHQCDAALQCYQLFHVPITKDLMREAMEYEYLDVVTLLRICAHHPSDALKLVKKIEQKGPANLAKACKKVAIAALRVLGREQQALALQSPRNR